MSPALLTEIKDSYTGTTNVKERMGIIARILYQKEVDHMQQRVTLYTAAGRTACMNGELICEKVFAGKRGNSGETFVEVLSVILKQKITGKLPAGREDGPWFFNVGSFVQLKIRHQRLSWRHRFFRKTNLLCLPDSFRRRISCASQSLSGEESPVPPRFFSVKNLLCLPDSFR